MDILEALYKKEITEDMAYDLLGKIIGPSFVPEDPNEIMEDIMMDRYEWTAQSACDLSQIARWRYEGWPETCGRCKRKIIKEKFGWRCEVVNGESGDLRHVSCDNDYLKSIGYSDAELGDEVL